MIWLLSKTTEQLFVFLVFSILFHVTRMEDNAIKETLVANEVPPKEEPVRKGGVLGSVWNLCNGILGI